MDFTTRVGLLSLLQCDHGRTLQLSYYSSGEKTAQVFSELLGEGSASPSSTVHQQIHRVNKILLKDNNIAAK